ncbi:MAG TPA: ATP-binding protein [Sporichthyaceae bacterium]|nr:ATP-binding protein [Sporichthyaceae bacterium]
MSATGSRRRRCGAGVRLDDVIGRRRMLAGFALAVLVLPGLTTVLDAGWARLPLVDDLLLYLVAVIAVTVVGGFWPAIVSAVASGLLLNWYFTPPVHAWTIDAPANMLALTLFVVIAVSVSGLVHLAARRAMLAAENRTRTALLAAVGHDLRTPLAAVKAAVSTLRQDDVTWSAEDQAALLETIEDGADRLTDLIANLLDISRLQSGVVRPHLRATTLHDLTPGLLRSLDAEQAAGLRLDIPADLPELETDPGLLERALANLVTNALRYSPPGRPPTLSARADGQLLRIRVVDHGPGIPPADRERIFAPFQQLGDAPNGSGLGLGLAVARGLTETLGGRLVASTTPGGGLTMQLDLPTARPRPVGSAP